MNIYLCIKITSLFTIFLINYVNKVHIFFNYPIQSFIHIQKTNKIVFSFIISLKFYREIYREILGFFWGNF